MSAIYETNLIGLIVFLFAQSFQELQDLMKADFSYKAYREELSHVQAPCIPYMWVHDQHVINISI
jgi:hypothetical protein